MSSNRDVFTVKFTPRASWPKGFNVSISYQHPDEIKRNDVKSKVSEVSPGAKFSKISADFITNMEAFFVSLPFILLVNQAQVAALIDHKLREACEANSVEKKKDGDGGELFHLEPRKVAILKPIFDEITVARDTMSMLPKSFVIQLSTQFDILVSSIMSAAILERPEILNTSDRKLEYSDLFSFGNIEEVKSHFMEKFVESLIRKSRREQFSWFATVLKMPMTKDLPSWPTFIEINERRNLFTHTGGIVST